MEGCVLLELHYFDLCIFIYLMRRKLNLIINGMGKGPRYYHDHLREMLNILGAYDIQEVKSAIAQCLSLKVYNAFDLKSMLQGMQQQQLSKPVEALNKNLELPQQANIVPNKSNINTYQIIMK